MSEATTPTTAPIDVLDTWGSREELKEMAERIRRFLPGAKKMNDQEVLAYAQYTHMTGLNPFRELYGWDSDGDGTGNLVTKIHYALIVRWAKSQENFSTRFVPMTEGLGTGDIGFHCQLLRQSDRPLLQDLLANGVGYREAIAFSTSIGRGIITAREKGKRKPPKGKDWPWVAQKRALEDAIIQAFGMPSTEELARQTWIVQDVLTTPEDWQSVTTEMLPAAREALALTNATRRSRAPLNQTAAESKRDLFGDELPDPTRAPENQAVQPGPQFVPSPTQEAPYTELEEPPPGWEEFEEGEFEEIEEEPTQELTEDPNYDLAGLALAFKTQIQDTAGGNLSRGRTGNPSSAQLGLLNGLFKDIVGEEQRKLVLAWIFDQPTLDFSTKSLSKAQVEAILDGLDPEKDDAGKYAPTNEKAVEAVKVMLRQARVDSGQMEMEV